LVHGGSYLSDTSVSVGILPGVYYNN